MSSYKIRCFAIAAAVALSAIMSIFAIYIASFISLTKLGDSRPVFSDLFYDAEKGYFWSYRKYNLRQVYFFTHESSWIASDATDWDEADVPKLGRAVVSLQEKHTPWINVSVGGWPWHSVGQIKYGLDESQTRSEMIGQIRVCGVGVPFGIIHAGNFLKSILFFMIIFLFFYYFLFIWIRQCRMQN